MAEVVRNPSCVTNRTIIQVRVVVYFSKDVVSAPATNTAAATSGWKALKLRLNLGRTAAPDKPGTFDARYPKLALLKEFVCADLLIACVDLLVRLLYYGIGLLHGRLGVAETPEALRSYLPLDVTRVLVTVMDAAAIVLSVALGVVTVIKIVREFAKGVQA